jgi:hypothetical protein
MAHSTSAARAAEAKARVEAAYAAAKGGSAPGSLSTPGGATHRSSNSSASEGGIPSLPERRRAWLRTGVLALRDLGLREVPSQVWEDGALPQPPVPVVGASTAGVQDMCTIADTDTGDAIGYAAPPEGGQNQSQASHSNRMSVDGVTAPAGLAPQQQLGSSNGSGPPVVPIRQADLSHNLLGAVPRGLLSALPHLTSLRLNNNRLADGGMPWAEIGQLGRLQVGGL